MDKKEVLRRFAALAQAPDDEVGLAEGALIIAAMEYPLLDLKQQAGLLDALSAGASHRLTGPRDSLADVNRLSEYLFDEVGFRGNQEDYYDPRNCFLNQVLLRRLGIPITLSLVGIEVGQRVGVPLVGVGMPGHFLLRHRDADGLYIDPFHRGVLRSEEECAQLFRQVTGSDAPWDPANLAPVSNREIVARILRNLKGIYLARQDHQRAINFVDMLLVLQPDGVENRRDRGLLLYRLGRYPAALDDLRAYLESVPPGLDASAERSLVSHIEDLLDS